ncbi:MAG: UDP-glucose/GDP-mannose dehydrogenase family protein [Polyangiaceae bacterium]|nr:UDP-glucose/GDP-mannose dehydrogenase family protein [Polyangiaceae bacterium]
MRIVVYGTGYVGLVTGTGLAEIGHEVLCVDIDPAKIESLKEGKIPIYEPGLGDLVKRNERSGRLTFTTKVTEPYDTADFYFIAVGTPPSADGSADISAVLAVGEEIARTAKRKAIVVVKSTVPVGTCDEVQKRIDALRAPLEVVSNPEFLKEGAAVSDFFRPDRIVIGVRSEHARDAVRDLYAPLQLSGERVVVTDPRSSELIKYASNSMLAMRVSFMNELSRLCEVSGADIHSVRHGMGSDTRIGKRFLYAGPGYGGSCFPKDVKALIALGKKYNVPMQIAEATESANEAQGDFLCELLESGLGGLSDKTVVLWGLSFKPETDDIRESPSIRVAERILAKGGRVRGHDPEGGPNFKQAVPRVELFDREYDALAGADALVLMTEWRSYRAPNFAEIKRKMKANETGALLLDARNVWKSSDIEKVGLRYQGIGVGKHKSFAS